ncbi:hypothetical protein BD779DRAFT_1788979 [Infundibulicybe gibba]|nr:hypothetical protein BD779DRAFT_1788979 [Infundibulicybe gibba]
MLFDSTKTSWAAATTSRRTYGRTGLARHHTRNESWRVDASCCVAGGSTGTITRVTVELRSLEANGKPSGVGCLSTWFHLAVDLPITDERRQEPQHPKDLLLKQLDLIPIATWPWEEKTPELEHVPCEVIPLVINDATPDTIISRKYHYMADFRIRTFRPGSLHEYTISVVT